jgi:hypothetical protein
MTLSGVANETRNSAAFRLSHSGHRVVLRRSVTVAKGQHRHKGRKKFMFVNRSFVLSGRNGAGK